MTSIVKFGALCAAALLSACGGGAGNSQSVDPRVAQASGHWVACWQSGVTESRKDDVHITGLGGLRSHVVRSYTLHAGSTDCSSPPELLQEEDSENTFTGETATLGGIVLDKFTVVGQIKDYTQGNTPVSVPSGTKGAAGVINSTTPATMRVGDEQGPLDANGYPTQLLDTVYQKQPS